jgi:hypothetical protein
MNKLIVSSLVAAALAASGGVFAQAAEGQAGSAYRTDDPNVAPGTERIYGNSGWTPPTVYFDGRHYYTTPYAQRGTHVYPYGRVDRRTQRDRDGDGVSNRRDRWPDDPTRS